MKKIIFFAFFVFSGIILVAAQQPTPQRTPHVPRGSRLETSAETRNRSEVNRGFDALENIGINNRQANSEFSRLAALQHIRNIYRKPNKKEIAILAPNQNDIEKYAQFLRGEDTGLVKLIADKDCGTNPNVLDASEECLKYSMPGAGASYSFRIKNYAVTSLSDVMYKDDQFQSFGNLTNGIFVNIGDVPFDQVSLQTNGLRFLTDFQPAAYFEEVKENYLIFKNGVERDGFIYKDGVIVQENTTYILRSIAYSGKSYRVIQGFLYDEFLFDKRKDKIVAFRIISRDKESVTIIWKQLAEKKSPEVKSKAKKSDSKVK